VLDETEERYPIQALYVYESVRLELNFLHDKANNPTISLEEYTHDELSNNVLLRG